jgi:hypothetical protein
MPKMLCSHPISFTYHPLYNPHLAYEFNLTKASGYKPHTPNKFNSQERPTIYETIHSYKLQLHASKSEISSS